MDNHWADIRIDISKLEDCQATIKAVLETVSSFSFIELPKGLFNAYWELSNVIKLMKFLNGEIKLTICDICKKETYVTYVKGNGLIICDHCEDDLRKEKIKKPLDNSSNLHK